MTYTGAMVLPQNAVIMQEEEMTYLVGGATSTWTAKASAVKKRLNSFIACGDAGSALSGFLTGIVTNSFLAGVMSYFTLGAWYSSWSNCARTAKGQASGFNNNTKVKLTIKTNNIYKCTSMSVKKA